MSSELDDFRPRIINWAREYRDRRGGVQSPLAVLLANLRLYDTDSKLKLPQEDGNEERMAIDKADSAFVESCFARLDASRRKVLRVAYLEPSSSEAFAACSDLKRRERLRARQLGLCRSSDYRRFLEDAETALMNTVHIAEEKFDLTKEDFR